MTYDGGRVRVIYHPTASLPRVEYDAYVTAFSPTQWRLTDANTKTTICLFTPEAQFTPGSYQLRAQWGLAGQWLGGYSHVPPSNSYLVSANVTGTTRWVEVMPLDQYRQERASERLEHVSLLVFGLILASIFLRSWTSKREVL